MNNQDIATKKVADFIYQKPDVVVTILKESGYDISIDDATLRQINDLTFTALFNQEEPFTSKFTNAYASDGYLNIEPISLSIMAGASIVSSIIGGARAKKEAEKQRALQKATFLANLTSQEKLKYEELKLLGETERTKILANSMLDYRIALQKEGTQRLKDTWIYLVGAGLGISLFYGLFLFTKDK
jgi:hypothetical protein